MVVQGESAAGQSAAVEHVMPPSHVGALPPVPVDDVDAADDDAVVAWPPVPMWLVVVPPVPELVPPLPKTGPPPEPQPGAAAAMARAARAAANRMFLVLGIDLSSLVARAAGTCWTLPWSDNRGDGARVGMLARSNP